MRTHTPFFAACLVLTLAACGDPSSKSVLLISATPQQVPGDGQSSAKIVVRARVFDQPVKDGTTINLTVTGGTFDPDKPDETTTRVRTVAGEGTATWYAPAFDPAGDNQYQITASYKDSLGNQKQAQTTLEVIEATPVDGVSFSFTCSARNVAQPQSGMDPLRLPCNVSATDIEGNPVPFDLSRFGFLAETGTFEIDRDGTLTWVVAPGQTPLDVDPLGDSTGGEPWWEDPSTHQKHNPRDGIATLVIHTRGTPTGTPDPLQGEPYVDANDNGQWDPGEVYYDDDRNGAYTPLGGGTGPRRIWRWVKVFLTGPVSEEAAQSSGIGLWSTSSGSLNLDIPYGGSENISVTLVDANLNPPASHPTSNAQDTIKIATTPSSAQITPRDGQALARDLATVVFQPSGTIDGASLRATWVQGLPSYEFKVTNGLSSTASDTPWSMQSITIRRTPIPTERTTITETLSPTTAPQGTLLANPN